MCIRDSFSPPRPARLAPPLCAASSDSHPVPFASGSDASSSRASGWVLVGCDSDAGGALAIVRGPSVGVVASVEVIDCPTVKVEVNGKLRTRLHAEAMVAALASLRLPPGQVAHLEEGGVEYGFSAQTAFCLLYTSPSPRDATLSRMPSSA